MSVKGLYAVIVVLAAAVVVLVVVNRGHAEAPSSVRQGPPAQSHARSEKLRNFDAEIVANANELLEDGRSTFRFDTFGDEAFWGGALMLHQAIKGAALGGVGPGISPSTALSLGLKVDVDALPQPLINKLKQGKVDLNDPATTVALLKLNAVVGVEGFFQGDNLNAVGITCAFCHSGVRDFTLSDLLAARHPSMHRSLRTVDEHSSNRFRLAFAPHGRWMPRVVKCSR